jgi:hypothetical protein
MEPMSFSDAQQAVVRYNKKRCARTVAHALKINYRDCFDLVDWLWNRTYPRHVDLVKTSARDKALLPELTKLVWLEYLYTRNVTPESAAASVGWRLKEVLRTCRGPQQWNRRKNRQPIGCAKPTRAADAADEEAIPEEEIYRRAEALRMTRPEDFRKPQLGRYGGKD